MAIGRGWDQNECPGKEFPTNEKLNELFPDMPVLLTRVDGHAAIANHKALEIAGVKAGDKISGGEIEVKNGKLTGILLTMLLILFAEKSLHRHLNKLKNHCWKHRKIVLPLGLTTIDDCGLGYEASLSLDSLQKNGDLKMRMYAMLSDAKANYDFAVQEGKNKN